MTSIDITPVARSELLALLQQFLPGVTVWAFGSRVKWTARSNSDLDLVVFSRPEQEAKVSLLKEALEESALPFRVDLLVWDNIPESFKNNIQEQYMVLIDSQKTMLGRVDVLDNVQWFEKSLGVITCNHDGKRKPVKESERRKGPYPYYGASGIIDYVDDYLFDGRYLLIAEDGENLRTRQTPIAFMADGKFWVNNHAHIVTGNGDVTTEYLHYFLQNADIKPYLTGAVMPKLTQGNLNRIPVRYPDTSYQKSIVKVLGDLDNKITLNHRTNQTLEQMAQAIFKSWFVDFDPVKAKMAALVAGGSEEDAVLAAMQAISGKNAAELLKQQAEQPEQYAELRATAELFPSAMQDSELGEIPEGWEVKQLSEICKVVNGRAYKNTEFKTEGTPIVRIQNLSNGGKTVYSDLELSPDKYIEGEDFIYAWSATFGPHIWRGPKSIYHYHIWKMEVDEFVVSRYFLYLSMFRKTEAMKNAGTGSIFTHLTKQIMESQLILVGNQSVNKKFSELVVPIFEQISSLNRGAGNLADIRDTLLPKLLSGELPVMDV